MFEHKVSISDITLRKGEECNEIFKTWCAQKRFYVMAFIRNVTISIEQNTENIGYVKKQVNTKKLNVILF